jgi:hypothetical protein
MYGLIHNSLRAMVKADLGIEVWAKIVEAAGLSEKDFLSLQSYDDGVVLTLLAATHDETGRSIDGLLYDFGLHFVKYTAFGHYAALMDMYGSTLWELLDSLNHMHDRIASSLPDYMPPSFRLTENGDGTHELLYSSTRQGLTAFVEGIIAGLASHYDVGVSVKVLEDKRSDQGQQTRFLLTTTQPE